MAEYATPMLNAGQQFVVAHAPESGMLPADDTSVESAAAFTSVLAGYTNIPGVAMPENSAPVYGAGMFEPAVFIHGRKEPTLDLTLNLGTGAAALATIRTALRATSAVAGNHMCLPVKAWAVQAQSECGDGDDNYQMLARYAQTNMLTINAAEGQPVTAALNIWALALDRAGDMPMPVSTPSAIRAAGGVSAFAWHDLSIEFNGTNYHDLLTGINLQINNNMRRQGTRPRSHTGFLARCARQISPGVGLVTITLNMMDFLPEAAVYSLGALSMVMSDGTNSRTITTVTNFIQNYAMGAFGPEAVPSYTATILSTGLAIT